MHVSSSFRAFTCTKVVQVMWLGRRHMGLEGRPGTPAQKVAQVRVRGALFLECSGVYLRKSCAGDVAGSSAHMGTRGGPGTPAQQVVQVKARGAFFLEFSGRLLAQTLCR